jgi:hypothetical protein
MKIKNIKIIDLMFLVSRVRFQLGCHLKPSSHLTLLNMCWWESPRKYKNNWCRSTWRSEIYTFSVEQGWYQFIQMLVVIAMRYLPHWFHKPWLETNYPTAKPTTWNWTIIKNIKWHVSYNPYQQPQNKQFLLLISKLQPHNKIGRKKFNTYILFNHLKAQARSLTSPSTNHTVIISL